MKNFLIPICAWCKKVRDEKGDWKEPGEYVAEHPESSFTHGICLECMEKVNLSENGDSSPVPIDI